MTKKNIPKPLIIVFIVLGVAVLAGALFACLTIISLNSDHDRFIKLSEQTSALYTKLKDLKDDSWYYAKSCSNGKTGDFTDGTVTCETSVKLEKTVTSVDQVADLQQTYYPIFKDSPDFHADESLNVQPAGIFGQQFVTSTAAQFFTLDDKHMQCIFTHTLSQTTSSYNNYYLGIAIENGLGKATLSFVCSDVAKQAWFPLES